MFKSIGQLELLGFTLGFVASCNPTRDAAGHCANQDGDAFCAEKYAGERTFCARGIEGCELEQLDGCVVSRPLEDACYSPCGGGKSLDEDPECDSVADGSSSSDSVGETEVTTEPTGGPTTAGSMSASGTEGSSSTTSSGCTLSAECPDAMSPICVDMACVPCSSDDECLAKDPNAPACGDDGRCVTCTPTNASACTDTTPVCNAVNECEGCAFHEQCPDSACRIATGGCFDPAEVYDVGSGQTYANIAAAVADLGAGGEVVLRIHDGPDYNAAVTVAGAGTAYAFLADDDAMVPQWVNTGGGEPTLEVESGAEVYVQSLRFTANTDADFAGIAVSGATLYLDRTRVVGNTGGGIRLTSDAIGHLRNSFVGGDVNQPALEVQDGTAFVLYSTVAGSFGNSPALTCGVGGDSEVRNSILVSQDDAAELNCPGSEVTNTATEAGVAGAGNVAVGDVDDAGWFLGYDSGNFSLTGAGAGVFGDIAQWMTGDPLVDIDGDARPNEDATADVAGADIP